MARTRPLIVALAASLLIAPAADARKPRPLQPGDRGKDVAAMQGYLAAIAFLPWTSVTGSYDYRTEQAVMAFEGWNGFDRNGVASLAVLRRLKHARMPKPSRRYHGKRLEVHVDQQVLLLVTKRNKVYRAIHVSTGAGGRTPEGDFSIFRKEEMSFSVPFGVWLPWASYFSGGFAFHQYPDVPGYPASHGCIRISSPEAQGVYEFAAYGTPAHVH
jgi:lipoprotein-anchoring transpeptidase ErfK/SrfK